jgi:hypothetical protein
MNWAKIRIRFGVILRGKSENGDKSAIRRRRAKPCRHCPLNCTLHSERCTIRCSLAAADADADNPLLFFTDDW